MSKPLLSILIPTVVGREEEFARLKMRIGIIFAKSGVAPGSVECRVAIDNKEMTIGEKRQKLYNEANGLYVWQVDDDDDISDDSILLIIRAIKQNPDCVTFQELCNINGTEYKSNHSIHYDQWEGDGSKEFEDGFHFHRTPFMKSVIKASIVQKVKIPFLRFGEDHNWAIDLLPHLETEVHIPENVYFYNHNSKPEDHNERYGINK